MIKYIILQLFSQTLLLPYDSQLLGMIIFTSQILVEKLLNRADRTFFGSVPNKHLISGGQVLQMRTSVQHCSTSLQCCLKTDFQYCDGHNILIHCDATGYF